MVQLIDVFNFKTYTFVKNPVGNTGEREQSSFALDQVWKHPKTVNLKYIAKWLQKQFVGNAVKIQWWDTSHMPAITDWRKAEKKLVSSEKRKNFPSLR